MVKRRWVGLWLSLSAVILGMALLLVFIEYFAVPRFLTGGFKPGKCVVSGFMLVPGDKTRGRKHKGCAQESDGMIPYVNRSHHREPVAPASGNESNETAFTSAYANISIMDNTKYEHDERMLLSDRQAYNSSVIEEKSETLCSHTNAVNYLGCIDVKHLSSNTQKPSLLNAQSSSVRNTSVSRLSIKNPPATTESFTESMKDAWNNNSNKEQAKKRLTLNVNPMNKQTESDQRELQQRGRAFEDMKEKEPGSGGDSALLSNNNGILYKHDVFQPRSKEEDPTKLNQSLQSRNIYPVVKSNSVGNESISNPNQSHSGTKGGYIMLKLNHTDNENVIFQRPSRVWNVSTMENISCHHVPFCTTLQVCTCISYLLNHQKAQHIK